MFVSKTSAPGHRFDLFNATLVTSLMDTTAVHTFPWLLRFNSALMSTMGTSAFATRDALSLTNLLCMSILLTSGTSPNLSI